MTTSKPPFPSVLVFLALVASALLLHLPVLGLTFFSDDFSVIHRIAGGDLGTGSFFRPLPDWTLYLNYLVTGFSPIGFRGINVLLLGLNAWLVYLLGRNLFMHDGSSRWSAPIIGALLFVCYPFHNEPQLWIIGRSTAMATSFTLLALIAATSRLGFVLKCVAVALCGALGALCYELALLLPLLLAALAFAAPSSERRTWWMMALITGAVAFSNLVLRSMLTGNMANAYGTSFFTHAFASYLAMAAKVFSRLFLPPNSAPMEQVFWSMGLLIALLVLAFALMRRTRHEPALRRQLLALIALVGIACAIGVVGGVSTRTSESDRFLYLPSAFLCLFIAVAIVSLFRGWARHACVWVLVIVSIIAMRQNHANWSIASRTIGNIVLGTPSAPASGRLFVQDLPGDHNGAFIFRHGYHEALLMANLDTARIVRVDTILHGTRDHRGVPALSNENREDTLFLGASDRTVSWARDRFVEKD